MFKEPPSPTLVSLACADTQLAPRCSLSLVALQKCSANYFISSYPQNSLRNLRALKMSLAVEAPTSPALCGFMYNMEKWMPYSHLYYQLSIWGHPPFVQTPPSSSQFWLTKTHTQFDSRTCCDVCTQLLSPVWFCMILWTAARQAPLSMGWSQARTLEWVVIFSFRSSPWTKDRTHDSCIGRRIFFTTEPPGSNDTCYNTHP